nr:IS110 family transposase [Cereibacter changlensis]
MCEAVGRPDMRFVPVKSRDQQAVLMLHRARDLLIRQRTMLINAFRAHLAETGHVAGLGRTGVTELLGVVEADDDRLTPLEREALSHLAGQIRDTADRITALERRILAWHRSSEASRRLETIPGVGPITASVIVASIGDGTTFRNARQFAAWLGLVPRQNSTGGKTRLGHITKWGDSYIRRLLVVSSCALIRYARAKPADENWLANVLSRRPAKVAAVAMANKTARIVWAVLVSGRLYQQEQPAAAT